MLETIPSLLLESIHFSFPRLSGKASWNHRERQLPFGCGFSWLPLCLSSASVSAAVRCLFLQNSLLKNTSVEQRFTFLNALDNFAALRIRWPLGPTHIIVFTLLPNGIAFVRMKRDEPTQCTACLKILTFFFFLRIF